LAATRGKVDHPGGSVIFRVRQTMPALCMEGRRFCFCETRIPRVWLVE